MYKITTLRPGCFVVTFDELMNTEYVTTTNILIVECKTAIYICDTYIDPKLMAQVLEDIGLTSVTKPFRVVLSHYHWDHVWGSDYFKNADIIASELCYEKMKYHHSEGIEEIGKILGQVGTSKLPTTLLTGRLHFTEDNVTVHSTPGHSTDSVSVFFGNERIVFCGDNAEYPVPTYCDITGNGAAHRKTLEEYLEFDADMYVPGHDRLLDKEDIQLNLEYVGDVMAGCIGRYQTGIFAAKHRTNF